MTDLLQAFGDGRKVPGTMSWAELATMFVIMPGRAGSPARRRKQRVAGHG